MIPRQLFRAIHTNFLLHASPRKTLLAKLRKKTGYTFVNCKKALELHNDDFDKAEQWLRQQAQEQGWSQAVKLQSRVTTQGLIAMIAEKNLGVLVEINCETDFVAKNKKFHDLAETVAHTVLKHGRTINGHDVTVKKTVLFNDTLKQLQAEDGKSLADHSALTIGTVGENIKIRRALCMNVDTNIKLYGCTHPSSANTAPISFGKYGALVALETSKNDKSLGTQLCQHVIGMNPVKIGDPTADLPNDVPEDETLLLFQDFLLDPSISVQQMLLNEDTKILDFARFETGEELEVERLLDSVETCG